MSRDVLEAGKLHGGERLEDRFKPNGQWDRAVGKVVAEFFLRRIRPVTFQNRVRTALKYSNEMDQPDVIQRDILKTAHELKVEQRNRAFDAMVDKKPSAGATKAKSSKSSKPGETRHQREPKVRAMVGEKERRELRLNSKDTAIFAPSGATRKLIVSS